MSRGAGKRRGWPLSLRLLHWLSALLVFLLFGVGLYMTSREVDVGTRFDLYQRHKSLGFTLLALTLLRLGLRPLRRRPDFPDGMPAWEIALAKMTHALFYVLLLLMALLGWLTASASPLPVPTRWFDLFPVPHLIGPNEAIYDVMRRLHLIGAWALVGLSLLHALAALKHHFVDRDATLRRMLRGEPSPLR